MRQARSVLDILKCYPKSLKVYYIALTTFNRGWRTTTVSRTIRRHSTFSFVIVRQLVPILEAFDFPALPEALCRTHVSTN